MLLLTSLTLLTYLQVALTNPGYIKGNKDDVDRRAGAYDPKHYQVNSERKKVRASEDTTLERAKHSHKLSYLSTVLSKKSRH